LKPALFPNAIPPSGRIPSFDGWRAIAILLVLGDHMVYTSFFPQDRLGWISYIGSGDLGVRIFFVLSGFLITFLLIGEADRNGRVSLSSFYARRALRIFPVYFAYLAVLGGLAVAGLYHDVAGSWVGCLTFTRNMVGRGDSATVHFWSLAVEEQFYLIWPILFGCLCLWKRKGVYLGVLVCLIVLCPFLRTFWMSSEHGATLLDRILGPRSILMYADSLAVGCIGAWLARRLPTGGPWKTSCNLWLLAALGVIVYTRYLEITLPGTFTHVVKGLVPSLQAWAILAALWLSAHPSAFTYRALNWKPVVWIGLLSYSIYIWHFLFVSYFMGPAFHDLPTHRWNVWVLPAIALAALSYYGLEMPLVSLRKHFRR